MSQNRALQYLGDQAVRKFMQKHNSETPFHVVRLRILGALASPNKDLVPIMVFASFWPEDGFPQLETKEQSRKFFDLFMGLWQRIEKQAAEFKPMLKSQGGVDDLEGVLKHLQERCEEIDAGFIEGFWGGKDDLPMTSASAALIDGLGMEAEWYAGLLMDLRALEKGAQNKAQIESLLLEIKEHDLICEDAIRSLLVLKSKDQAN